MNFSKNKKKNFEMPSTKWRPQWLEKKSTMNLHDLPGTSRVGEGMNIYGSKAESL